MALACLRRGLFRPSLWVLACALLAAACSRRATERMILGTLDAEQVALLSEEATRGATAELYERAMAGDAFSQRRLAAMYASGVGLPQNLTAAVDWFKRSAEQGDCASSFELGLLYLGRQGMPPDMDEATLWLRRALDHQDECSS